MAFLQLPVSLQWKYRNTSSHIIGGQYIIFPGAECDVTRSTSSCKHRIQQFQTTGFPIKAKQYATTYINIVGKLFNECADFRRTGSAALDLAYVAAGRVDGFFEIGLRPWDFAAGELLVREAGGIVSDFTGGHNYMLTGNIVAGNPRVVKAMLANMRDELSDALKR